MNNNVEFVTLTPNETFPIPAVKGLPKWYKKAKKYQEDGNSAFKNCVPFFESMAAGYVMLTPCEVHFYQINGEPFVKLSKKYEKFVTKRSPMGEFHVPEGYCQTHFAWLPEWGVRTPEGYNSLYLTPLNSYGLPFINTSGIINTDKVFRPGSVPFFLKTGYEGTIPKGTPYLQIIPIKRETWSHTLVDISNETFKYFAPNAPHVQNYYRDNLWEMSKYE